MTIQIPKLGYLDTINQVLPNEQNHEQILQVLKQTDEQGFKQLAPYLFTTISTTEPLVAVPLAATKEGYQQFKRYLLEQEKKDGIY